MPKHIWTEEKVIQLKELIQEYTSNEKVASILGIKRNQVENALKTYGLKRENPKTVTPKDIAYEKVQCKYPELGYCYEVTSHKTVKNTRPRIRNNKKQIVITRYLWEKEKGIIPEGLWVLHKCDNALCINLEHLYLGTVDDNTQDRVSRDRGAKGSKNGASKLSEENVKDIKALLKEGSISLLEIGKKFGVGKTTISAIKNNRNWAWVK